MLVLDIIITLLIILLVLGAVGLYRLLYAANHPEIKGNRNLEKDREEANRKCHHCRKPTDLSVDIYLKPYWYHRKCWRNEEQ